MQHTKKLFASATVLALGLALGFGLAQLGSAEAGPTSQEVSQTAMRDAAASDLPDMVPQGIFVRVAEQVTPAVVYIQAEHEVRGRMAQQGLPEFFRRFFDEESGETLPDDHPDFGDTQTSQGSGFLVTPDGYIVTNAHVVSTYETDPPEVFEAASVTVTLASEDQYDAEIVGVDLGTDIAVLKIDASGLPHLDWGSSDGTRVGEWVMALGAPFGLTETVSAGIISAKGRAINQTTPQAYQDYIQTDAAINPGNSGGPLVNLRGEIIGVNTLIVTSGFDQRFAGVGFATPVDLVSKVADQLITTGQVVRGWLGVGIQPMDDETAEGLGLDPREARDAVFLPSVNDAGPADQAGLQPYDVVVAMNGEELEGTQDFLQRIALTPPGETVTLTVLRDGETLEFDIDLAQRPEEIDVFADALQPDEATPDRRGRDREQEAPGRTDAAREIGLQVQNLTARQARELGYEGMDGVLITSVAPNSPAFRKGLQRGMLVLEVNRRPVGSVGEFQEELAAVDPGAVVMFRVHTPQGNLILSVRMPEEN